MDKDTSAAPSRPEGDATAGLRDHRYPEGTFAGLIGTPFVTAPTRAALTARMAKPAVTEPRFLSPAEFALLGAVCDRLLDQDGDDRRIDVPGAVDARLASGETDGWRYDALPDDGAAMKRGLAGFDETARALTGRGFLDLGPDERDRVIGAVEAGDPPGAAWADLPAKRFFEDLLAAATESYYAHPLAQEEIGYAGYADARGWQKIELDQREPREPEPVGGPR
ncbi:gluconate 2-dehydrogenase subunit 3 family protein [Lichenibacterium dinghuense]|uniref:gluconate 2-dehydrogenase subunit 3 family protein n=1 Tax=Lichenibacterium dinghuense TaxID=2895977 RepID=UPI001F1D5012|nr:gluconate 2-dehydrogenase subunit 3 family protein [Lichenibacterium sp. 6Y81]